MNVHYPWYTTGGRLALHQLDSSIWRMLGHPDFLLPTSFLIQAGLVPAPSSWPRAASFSHWSDSNLSTCLFTCFWTARWAGARSKWQELTLLCSAKGWSHWSANHLWPTNPVFLNHGTTMSLFSFYATLWKQSLIQIPFSRNWSFFSVFHVKFF